MKSSILLPQLHFFETANYKILKSEGGSQPRYSLSNIVLSGKILGTDFAREIEMTL